MEKIQISGYATKFPEFKFIFFFFSSVEFIFVISYYTIDRIKSQTVEYHFVLMPSSLELDVGSKDLC